MPEKLRVFICHAKEDHPVVNELVARLPADEFDVWIDDKDLHPGEDWELKIREAVEQADAVIVCLSSKSVKKIGYVQKELRLILDIALLKPEGMIFVLPVRLDECTPPHNLKRLQWADYFPENAREEAFKRILDSLRLQAETLKARPPAVAQPREVHPKTNSPPRKVHPDRHRKLKKKRGWSRKQKNLFTFSVVGLIVMALIILVVKYIPVSLILTSSPSPTASLAVTLPPTETGTPSPTGTATLTKTPTAPATFTPTVDNTCILASVWTPYTSDVTKPPEENGICWRLSDWGMALYNNQFSFLSSEFRGGEWYDVSRPVPKSVIVEFTMTVTNLNNAEIWIGLAEGSDPTRSGVFLVRQPNGLFDIRILEKNGTSRTESNDNQVAVINGAHSVKFNLQGERMAVYINNRMWYYEDIPAPFASPRLHVGYRSLLTGAINAKITVPTTTEITPR